MAPQVLAIATRIGGPSFAKRSGALCKGDPMRSFPKIIVVAMLALAACAVGVGETGTVEVPLSTIGADGATYRLPEGSQVLLTNGEYFQYLLVDGPEASLHVEVPVGSVNATLWNPAGYADRWPLVRELADGTTDTVMATLATPLPATVEVAEGQTASIAFSFVVAQIGTISFAHGAVDISVAVGSA